MRNRPSEKTFAMVEAGRKGAAADDIITRAAIDGVRTGAAVDDITPSTEAMPFRQKTTFRQATDEITSRTINSPHQATHPMPPQTGVSKRIKPCLKRTASSDNPGWPQTGSRAHGRVGVGRSGLWTRPRIHRGDGNGPGAGKSTIWPGWVARGPGESAGWLTPRSRGIRVW